MKWTIENFPMEMQALPAIVREKAIEIANRMKKEKSVNELAIVEEAIRQAEEWFLNKEK
ncbi:DUF2188 domain-containing protein [Pedobacter nutrimenti]|jgi:uncharacterized protein YdaT|uniref:Uncharacterized protein n=1 Tax=Pedobacter nutrimenti TaxID=1241337 RepID=A0A318UEP3_9SPHI|nr:hypothetical protein [Pedobacter nutrimenti]PYF74862.1 hypothetical protein B0O44_103308 [Pedobacter nutrimenti]